MKRNIERRKTPRHTFEFFILEYNPDPEALIKNRCLECLDFSQGGLRLKGKPKFDEFKVTIQIPHDNSKVDAFVRLVYKKNEYFGVEFVKPTKELLTKLKWWV